MALVLGFGSREVARVLSVVIVDGPPASTFHPRYLRRHYKLHHHHHGVRSSANARSLLFPLTPEGSGFRTLFLHLPLPFCLPAQCHFSDAVETVRSSNCTTRLASPLPHYSAAILQFHFAWGITCWWLLSLIPY